MQNKNQKVKEVHKPYLTGSWHGRDAWKRGIKYMLSVLLVSMIYLISSMIMGFDSLIGRIIAAAAVVFALGYYQYAQGMAQGEKDTAFGETMYLRQESGKTVVSEDMERCFHPAKGFFIAALGALPFVLFAAVFACITSETSYGLGILPGWTENLLMQSEFGDALAYYGNRTGLQAMDILRVIDRAMVMPFASVGAYLGNHAALVVERISPLLVLIVPACYGLGYTQGVNARVRVNTAIKLGVDKKKRKERKARKQRQQQRKQPEQLI